MSRWFLKLEKRYLAEIALGAETDTLDTEGQIVAEAPVPAFETIRSAAEGYRGTIMQIPPMYSALKIDGQRSYALARSGSEHLLSPRSVVVYDLNLIQKTQETYEMTVHCGSGTYIRALARDIGAGNGERCPRETLSRTTVGPFSLSMHELRGTARQID